MMNIARIAHHEAGHAIMATLVGVSFSSVSIVPDDRSNGRILGPFSSYDKPLWHERMCLIMLGGNVAEEIHVPDESCNLLRATQGDMDHAVEYMSEVLEGDDAFFYLAGLEELAKEVMSRPEIRQSTQKLAAALMEKSSLSEIEAYSVMGIHPGGRCPQFLPEWKENFDAEPYRKKWEEAGPRILDALMADTEEAARMREILNIAA